MREDRRPGVRSNAPASGGACAPAVRHPGRSVTWVREVFSDWLSDRREMEYQCRCMTLPWFQDRCPLYLAPMAGVTDSIFRQLCKEQGADVMVTEFVSAEGIFRRNERTLEYLEFVEAERPLGVQLFGGDPAHLGEAARMVVDWKRPDFIDLNFGCPVNKVVSKQGGSSLLRDCPLLERVARAVVQAVAPHPVTAKMRIGWSDATINRHFAFLRHVLMLAVKDGKLTQNPVSGLKFFPEVKRTRWLAGVELERLRGVMRQSDWKLVAFAIETGLRWESNFA